MRTWNEIRPAAGILKTVGEINPPVERITFDSRKVGLNCCFIAQKGTHTDGHQYIQNAIEKGATVIV